MSIELATAYVSLIPSARGAGKQIEKDLGEAGDAGGKVAGDRAGRSLTSHVGGFLKKSLVGVGVTAGVALGGVIVKGFGDAFAQSDATTKFKQSLDFAGITKGQIDKATKITQKYADDTVFDLSTVQNTAAQLAANGVKDFTGLTMAAGNLNAVAGGNADTFRGVAMALTQTVGAGKLTTENWNQIADAIPGASGVLQAALKKNKAFTGDFRDAMAKGQITAEEFNKALMQVGNRPIAQKAATSTATFEGAMGNLMATITGGFAKFLNNIKPQLTAVIGAISTGFGKAFDVIKSVFGFIGDHTKLFGTLAAVVGTAAAAWALWTGAVKAWQLATKIATAVQVAFNAVMNANPIMLVVTAIAALAAGFAYLWTHSKSFRDFWVGLWDKIKSAAAAVADWFKTKVLPAFKPTFDAIKRIVGDVVGIFKGLWKFVSGIFTGNWSKAWDGIKKIFGSWWDGIKTIAGSIVKFFGKLPGKIWGAIKAVSSWLIGKAGDLIGWILTGIKKVAGKVWGWFRDLPGKAWAGVKAASSRILGYGKTFLTWIWNGIKNVAGDVWRWFKDLPGNIWSRIKSAATWLVNRGKSILNWLWGGIKSVAGNVWGWFRALPGKVWDSIARLQSWLITKGGKIIGWIWSGIKGGASAVWDWFAGIGGKIWGGISGLAEKIGGFGGKIIGWIKNGITGGASAIWDWFKNIPWKIASAASNIWNSIKAFGSGIINKIGDGISSVASTIADGVTGAVKDAVNAAIWVVNKIIDGFNGALNGVSHLWSWAGIPAIPSIPHIPSFAKGGMLQEGFNIVNELGPELLLKSGANVRVIPAQPSAQMMKPAATATAATRTGPLIGQVNINERMSPSRLATELNRQLAFAGRVG